MEIQPIHAESKVFKKSMVSMVVVSIVVAGSYTAVNGTSLGGTINGTIFFPSGIGHKTNNITMNLLHFTKDPCNNNYDYNSSFTKDLNATPMDDSNNTFIYSVGDLADGFYGIRIQEAQSASGKDLNASGIFAFKGGSILIGNGSRSDGNKTIYHDTYYSAYWSNFPDYNFNHNLIEISSIQTQQSINFALEKQKSVNLRIELNTSSLYDFNTTYSAGYSKFKIVPSLSTASMYSEIGIDSVGRELTIQSGTQNIDLNFSVPDNDYYTFTAGASINFYSGWIEGEQNISSIYMTKILDSNLSNNGSGETINTSLTLRGTTFSLSDSYSGENNLSGINVRESSSSNSGSNIQYWFTNDIVNRTTPVYVPIFEMTDAYIYTWHYTLTPTGTHHYSTYYYNGSNWYTSSDFWSLSSKYFNITPTTTITGIPKYATITTSTYSSYQSTLSASALAFNSIQTNTSSAMDFTITNPNAEACDANITYTIEKQNASSPFTFSPSSCTLASGASCTVRVTFSPASSGYFSDYLKIGNYTWVSLSGSATDYIAPQTNTVTLSFGTSSGSGTSSEGAASSAPAIAPTVTVPETASVTKNDESGATTIQTQAITVAENTQSTTNIEIPTSSTTEQKTVVATVTVTDTTTGEKVETKVSTPVSNDLKVEAQADGSVKQTLTIKESTITDPTTPAPEVKDVVATVIAKPDGSVDAKVAATNTATGETIERNVNVPAGSTVDMKADGTLVVETNVKSSAGEIKVSTQTSPTGETLATVTAPSGQVYTRNIPKDAAYTLTELVEMVNALFSSNYNAVSTKLQSSRSFVVAERRGGGISIKSTRNEFDLSGASRVEIFPLTQWQRFDDVLRFDGRRTLKLLMGEANIIADGVSKKMVKDVTYILPANESGSESSASSITSDVAEYIKTTNGGKWAVDGIFYQTGEGAWDWTYCSNANGACYKLLGAETKTSFKYDMNPVAKPSSYLSKGYFVAYEKDGGRDGLKWVYATTSPTRFVAKLSGATGDLKLMDWDMNVNANIQSLYVTTDEKSIEFK